MYTVLLYVTIVGHVPKEEESKVAKKQKESTGQFNITVYSTSCWNKHSLPHLMKSLTKNVEVATLV